MSRNPPALVEGRFKVAEELGLGVEINENLLEKYRVDAIAGAYLDGERKNWFPIKPAY